ncbi:MAG: TIGR03032 family protein [Alphaproteobacteria bacterium]
MKETDNIEIAGATERTDRKRTDRKPTGAGPASVPLQLTPSPHLYEWLADLTISLAFTTHQVGKLFLVGRQPEGRLSIFERTLNRCMGMVADGSSLYVSSLYQLWRFENALAPGQVSNGFDRVYVPQVGHVTGDLDIHDLAIDRSGRVVFVNTLFGCLASTSETHSFTPLWKPPFLTKLAAEDRCHLNGLAMCDGVPAFATAVSESDVVDGWREHRRDGGCVIDVQANEVVVRGLSMPHSPRWHDDRLWLHNSGTGDFGHVDLKHGRFEPVCFCPGYLRGLAFVGDYAVMGLSMPRDNEAFQDLPLEDALATRKANARCRIVVVDLRTGDAVHSLRIDGVVKELYDVVVLPDTVRPMAIGFQGDEIRRVITVGD